MKNSPEVRTLITALIQLVGNKRYMHEITELFNKIELSPEERRAISLLASDINFERISQSNKANKARMGRIF